jgi:glucokinase
MLLAGDIGGTKTTLALYRSTDDIHHPLQHARFPSDDFDSLEAMVETFLARFDYRVSHAAFGVAGPIEGGRAKVTNLPWHISEASLTARFGCQRVRLINDLEAVATAIPHLSAEHLHTINSGRPSAHGPIGVIAPGTGLGEAFLVWDGAGYRAFPSEGGHKDFGPNNDLEWGLLRFMRAQLGFTHVSYENVCSGIGIPNIYDYLKHTGFAAEEHWLAERLAGAEDRTPIIIGAAQGTERSSPLCVETLRLFIAILGAEAGNLALTLLTTGGVYLGGGIPPRILAQLSGGGFMVAFANKGRFRELVTDVPVKVILHPEAGLLGAAAALVSLVNQS